MTDAALPIAPPRTGPTAWLRTNLFGSWRNTLISLGSFALLVWAVPPLLDWFLFESRWGDTPPAECRKAAGACWAFVHEKHRLILFGRYPFAEQWRPLVGMAILLGLIGASCYRPFWRRWLLAVWAVGIAVMAVLMWGGVFGLRFVETTLWGGLPLTFLLTTVGVGAAFPLGVVLALGRRSKLPIIRAVSIGYIELVRGVPLVSLLFMASFMFPLFMPSGVQINALIRAQVAIILFAGAYLAEVVRGGLQAVPRGQIEAAAALGMGYWLTMRKIVLPQAIRLVIPGIVNSFISTFKDTSLVAIVSLSDLMLSTRQAIADPLWRPFFVEGYVFIGAIYLVFCFLMSRYSQHLEVQLNTGRRR
ncbi:MAG: amino acid ABC transporter permease [Alphaproteobacteria bacterium]|nr:amino acid ABC transporter permease [Alphaproteobacteria bacterium]